MKKLILIFVVLAFVTVNHASAEMVDIGLGEMEQSDFMALKAKVQGQPLDIVPVFATPLDPPQRYGMVEMTRADFTSLGDKMAGRRVTIDDRPAVKEIQMVNIGTGEMAMDEFIALKIMVEGIDIIRLEHLAVTRP